MLGHAGLVVRVVWKLEYLDVYEIACRVFAALHSVCDRSPGNMARRVCPMALGTGRENMGTMFSWTFRRQKSCRTKVLPRFDHEQVVGR